MAKKTALILSGGGAKGAFQCGAEKYAREVKGYTWDTIYGVSVGALNATMLAMEKWERLWEVWNTISSAQVYTGGFNLLSMLKVALGAKSFYGNEPLQQLLAQELEPEKIRHALRIGAVSLVSGDYILYQENDPHLKQAVLASTVMPIIWTPVDISPQYPSMVDGGVRNITPIGDVLSEDPDEVVIINCNAQAASALPAPPKNIVGIGLRTLDILLNELFVSDMREFVRINHLVREAAAGGIVLHHPDSGRELKYYDCKIIEPLLPLGDTLDFSQATIQRSLKAGWERAIQVLG